VRSAYAALQERLAEDDEPWNLRQCRPMAAPTTLSSRRRRRCGRSSRTTPARVCAMFLTGSIPASRPVHRSHRQPWTKCSCGGYDPSRCPLPWRGPGADWRSVMDAWPFMSSRAIPVSVGDTSGSASCPGSASLLRRPPGFFGSSMPAGCSCAPAVASPTSRWPAGSTTRLTWCASGMRWPAAHPVNGSPPAPVFTRL
jgi:hypothetical protein